MADDGCEELDAVPEQSAHTRAKPEMSSSAIGERVLSQAFEIWFNAELERRSAAGELNEGFSLYAAQVLFPPDGEGEIEIRFNEQVTGSMLVVAQRPVEEGGKFLSPTSPRFNDMSLMMPILIVGTLQSFVGETVG